MANSGILMNLLTKYNLNRDSTIKDISRVCDIEGVSYGAVVAAINAFYPKAKKAENKPDVYVKLKRCMWTREDKAKVIELRHAGYSFADIAKVVNRSEHATATAYYINGGAKRERTVK